MKHKIQSVNRADFDTMWDDLMAKLNDAGEVVVKSKITLATQYPSIYSKYKAVVWTKHENA